MNKVEQKHRVAAHAVLNSGGGGINYQMWWRDGYFAPGGRMSDATLTDPKHRAWTDAAEALAQLIANLDPRGAPPAEQHADTPITVGTLRALLDAAEVLKMERAKADDERFYQNTGRYPRRLWAAMVTKSPLLEALESRFPR